MEQGLRKKSSKLKELLGLIKKDSVPVVLLNWKVISGKDGFQEHIVPVIGHDSKTIYVHNPGLLNPSAHFPISRERFIKSWESKVTDKDVVVIYRK